jgi:DNA gyrase/topoisomerase IV subunit A
MPSQPTLDFEGIERQSLRKFTEKAYLDYSMYVILDRALPRRIRAPSRRSRASRASAR